MPALVVLVVLLSVVCIGSSVGDWKKIPVIMESFERLSVPMSVRPLLPVFKTAGALGIIIGLRVKPLGGLAAIGLVLYFLGAVYFHTRANDQPKDTIPAVVLAVLAVAVLGLRLVVK